MRASVDLQLCEYPFYDLPDRFGRKPFTPAMVVVTAEQCAASESVAIQIFPQYPDRRGVQMDRLFIIPAFAADQCGFVPQVNICDIQPDDLDLPKPLKQKESDKRSQSQILRVDGKSEQYRCNFPMSASCKPSLRCSRLCMNPRT